MDRPGHTDLTRDALVDRALRRALFHNREVDMSGEEITISTPDGDFMGYLSKPASGSGPGIVVIQEIFGVNQVMRDITDDFAAKGFVALCPDLFWRIEPGVNITDQSKAEWDKAFSLLVSLTGTRVRKTLPQPLQHCAVCPVAPARSAQWAFALAA
jgi:hypothetical protein